MRKETAIALNRRLSDVVAEYDEKVAIVPATIAAFEKAGSDLKMAATIGGTYSRENIETGRTCERTIKRSLLKSAWLHVYDGLNIAYIASAKDKKLFEQTLENPVEFTLKNIKATFGHYITDPRGNILRGLAEVFCDLDPAYKSHDKVRIGVKGLPKRIILPNVSDYGWGRDRLQNILNALAAYQGREMASYGEVGELLDNGDALLGSRGVRLVRYANGNGHLFFEPQELRDINMALAEYYGEVLPDAAGDEPTQKKESREVAKDLQYYPTPAKVVERVVDTLGNMKGELVLEPSCGCGRFMDALRAKGAEVHGVEYDIGRAEQTRAKGHAVMRANFLELVPQPIYDSVVMNPPFYGKHYAKHVRHAMQFLKEGGSLTAILPATARYDHGLLDDLRGRWCDLPVGAFAESGTNITTTVFTAFK